MYPRVEDANLSGDQHGRPVAAPSLRPRSATRRTPRAPASARSEPWGDWDGVNVVLQTDLNRDDYQDLVVRDSGSGDGLLDALRARHASTWTTKTIFANWKSRTRIITPGDVTGDYKPDVLSVDSAGALWIYPGNGNGTFGTPVEGRHRLEPVQLDRRPRRLQRRRQGRPAGPHQDRLGRLPPQGQRQDRLPGLRGPGQGAHLGRLQHPGHPRRRDRRRKGRLPGP